MLWLLGVVAYLMLVCLTCRAFRVATRQGPEAPRVTFDTASGAGYGAASGAAPDPADDLPDRAA